ncbi:hypothetical protein CABS01_09920 [Colletotrichum abscissum]|uniref:F-box domain protein n=1 Tax=Colletotrichum abscissum TaxID=1671311 RepID=A0A9P9XN38_9PEZI|nr:uncharacterized protein CABS01_09920 [Colletotrichum abscissum]KAI3556973.1 hypothetical protein CABS02_02980 [Colletotrichum abscissum]KAK1501185.1 hypothetical protein CABS01_09920 [Colletotrichum abscissum]
MANEATPTAILWDWDQSDLTPAVEDMRRLLGNVSNLAAIRDVTLRGVRAAKDSQTALLAKRLTSSDKATIQSWITESRLPAERTEALLQESELSLAQTTAILLSRPPALKTLEVQTYDRNDHDEWTQSRPSGDEFLTLFSQLVASNSVAGSSFSNVESVKVLVPTPDEDSANEFNFYVYAENILPFFYLPQIRTLELHRVEDGGKSIIWPTPHPKPSAATLEELVLSRCQLSEGNVGQLLRASPNLKTFRCGYVIDAEYASDWVDLEVLRSSLDPLKASLEELSFALTLWTSTAIDCGEVGPWGIRGSFGSLKDFTRLTRLSISLPVLLGWETKGSSKLADVLPEGLQALTITNEMFFWWHYRWDDLDWEEDDPVVPMWQSLEAKIVEYLESRPRHLKELRLEISMVGEEQRAEELKANLIARGSEAGVTITVELKP